MDNRHKQQVILIWD